MPLRLPESEAGWGVLCAAGRVAQQPAASLWRRRCGRCPPVPRSHQVAGAGGEAGADRQVSLFPRECQCPYPVWRGTAGARCRYPVPVPGVTEHRPLWQSTASAKCPQAVPGAGAR